MNKYEQLIEAIIGDDQARAKSLFHSIVVEKSRSIYESLLDTDGEEMSSSGHSASGRFGKSQPDADDTEMQEGKMSEVAMVMQDIASGERDIHEVLANPANPAEEQAGEQLQSMYDEIAAESGLHPDDDFDKIIDMVVDKLADEYSDESVNEEEMDDEEGEESDDAENMDFDASGDLDSHETEHVDVEDRVMDLEAALDELRAEFDEIMAHEAGEEEEGEESEEMDNEESEEEMGGDGDSIPDAHKDQSSAVDVMREYVEKVATPANTDQATNKTSVVAKKNDMGGTTANIARGGAASAGGKVKTPQEIDVAKRNVNKPGGNGADKFFSGKAKTAGLSEAARKTIRKSIKK